VELTLKNLLGVERPFFGALLRKCIQPGIEDYNYHLKLGKKSNTKLPIGCNSVN